MARFINSFKDVIPNLKAGLTLALVATPGAISLAVASGVNPVVGMITATWTGLVGALCGGSHYNILGMTGALTGIVASYALVYGADTVASLTIVSGVLMLIAYLMRLERYMIFIPSSVIHGFTLGVAGMIFFTQINPALGLENIPKHTKFMANIFESLKHVHQFSWIAVCAFSFFFICLQILRRVVPSIPGAIIVAPMGIVIGYLSTIGILPFKIQTLGNQFGALTPTLIQFPKLTFSTAMLSPAFVIAFIAILETMLAAKIADVLTKTKHNGPREMFGLALANIVSGFVGGIPATAALGRTTYNINAGATNALSALFSSIFMGAITFVCLSYFAYMPMAAIAAILTSISINMVEREHFRRLYTHDKANFCIAVLVALIMIGENPIVGILAGAVMALLILVNQLAESNYEVMIHEPHRNAPSDMKDAKSQNILVYMFKGKLVYLNSQAHIMRFQTDFTEYQGIILQFHDLYYIDLDGIDAIEEIIEIIENRGQTVALLAPNAQIKNMLSKCKMYQKLEIEGRIFDTLHEAL